MLTTAIDIIAPEFVSLSIHTPNNIAQMKIWAKNNNLGHRVKIFDGYPEFNQKLICPVIIANAARNHEKAIGLSRRMPVLAERHYLELIATKRLAEIAVINNTYLAASNVFLFASYIQDFQKQLRSAKKKLPSSASAGLTHKLKRGVGKQNILTLASLFLKTGCPTLCLF